MTYGVEFSFRFDVGHSVGAGHFMRQLAIAQQAAKHGSATLLLPSMTVALRDKIPTSIGTFDLPTLPPEQEVAWLRGQVSKSSVVFIDSYRLPADYYRDVSQLAFAVAIEDGERSHPCQLTIKPRPAEEQTAEPTTRPLLEGCDYIPIREEFLRSGASARTPGQSMPTLLVCFGASDPTGHTRKVLSQIPRTDQPWRIVVVSGPLASSDHGEQLPHRELAAKGFDVEVVRNPNMPELLSRVDAAITSAGSILWELAATGVATLAIPIAPNQLRNARVLRESGSIAGIEELKEFLSNASMRERLRRRFSRLIDGRGAERIVSATLERMG